MMMYQSQFIEMFGDCSNPKYPVYYLGDVCSVQRGGSPRPISEYITEDSDGLNWIKIGDADDSMFITKTAEKIKPSGLKKTRQVYAGDLLLSNSMSFGRPYILKIDGCIHDGWLVLHFDQGKIDPIYLCCYLSQKRTYLEMAKLAAGGVVNNLNSEVVKKVPAIIPPISIQKQYVSIVEQADKSKFDGFKSQFIEMFGDPVELQEDDTNRSVSSCCSITSGFPFSSELFTETIGNGMPLVRIRDVARGYSETYTEEQCDPKYIVHREDLLIGMDGMFDICPWQSENALLNQRVCMIRPNDFDVSPGLLIHAIKPVLKSIENITNGTTVKHLSAAQVGEIRLPNCSQEESDRFNAIVEQADKSKSVCRQAIKRLVS